MGYSLGNLFADGTDYSVANVFAEKKEDDNKKQDLLKATFKPQREVVADEPKPDATAEYEKKALENIAGSMVFVERKKLVVDKL